MIRIWLWAAIGVSVCVSLSRGEGLPSADKIASLVDQLNLPSYAERQAASQQLEEAGALALPQLEAAATAGSREAAVRAFDILKRHFQNGGDELKAPAAEALARLAESKTATTAQARRDVLNPPPPATLAVPQVPNRVANFGGIWTPNGGLRQVRVSDFDGRKLIEVDDRERNIKIDAAARGGIQAQVTDKQNPRNGTRKIEARDLDDLKRKDAELGRLYEQYHGQGRRQFGAVNPALPFGFAPAVPAPPPGNPAAQVEMLDRLMELYKRRLATEPAVQGMIDALSAPRERYQAQLPAHEVARNPR